MPGPRLSLSEAARQLGVTSKRVDAMVRAGQLPAERTGSQWTVPASAVRSFENNRWRGAGRPLSQPSAWKLLRVELEAGRPRGHAELDLLRRRLRARAHHLEVFVPTGYLSRLREDRRVVLGGRDAAAAAGAPVDPGEAVDIYLRQSASDGLIADYRAVRVAEDANVRLHVIEDRAWPFDADQRAVGSWIAWLDLVDVRDRGADTLLDRLIGGRLHA